METRIPSRDVNNRHVRPVLDYDNKAACAYLGVSPKVLARLRKLSLLRATKVGAFWFYKQEWLDEYLDSVTIRRAE